MRRFIKRKRARDGCGFARDGGPRQEQPRRSVKGGARVLSVQQMLIVWCALVSIGCGERRGGVHVIVPPVGEAYTEIVLHGKTVLPNGRVITPHGRSYQVAPHPYGLTLSHDGTIAVTANSGASPLSISIVRDLLSENPQIQQIPPGALTDEGVLASVYMGLAVSPDNSVVYVSGGQENCIYLFEASTGNPRGSIDCAGLTRARGSADGYIGDMVLSRTGLMLYAVDQINFKVVAIDTRSRRVAGEIRVGRYPFGIALSPDESKLYVANVGMFEYAPIGGTDEADLASTAPSYPPFAYGTEEMRKGYQSGNLTVPGLGDPNAPESFSVWTIDLTAAGGPAVAAKIKTGNLVGQPVEGIPAVGGSSPNSLAVTSKYVFVSNGNNDNISVIDVAKDTVIHTIPLILDPRLRSFRGVIPFGLAVSPDEKRLYVAESGINAVGVIDVPTMRVVGHIPVGWFPSKLKVSPDGRTLVVANAKGYGSGPNGGKGFTPGPEGTYIGSLMKGTVTVLEIPSDDELRSLTETVVANNFRFELSSASVFEWRQANPIPLFPGQRKSPIKHIVFISKENRTYDEVFGQITEGRGDASLARYGAGVTFSNRARTQTVDDAIVMPNHLALARQFAIADNFYVDSDVSADGHRWLVNTYPNEWVEVNAVASTGNNRTFNAASKAPGRLAMNGSAGAIYPEDYNEAGSMWEHLERNGVEFYNFGFGVMFEPASYEAYYTDTGIRHLYNFPLPGPMFERTSTSYPTYNMAIPDQFRVDRFIAEFTERWGAADSSLPAIVTVILPNDHGAQERPEAGYPFRESYMADNDLALGRIVEFLSHTRFWKEMAIVVTEDDAQNGVDHIDAHRSLLMVISPHAKRGHVSHTHYSFGSIFKTFWNILGIPYLNQYDAGAHDLAELFEDEADFTPYNALMVDSRMFDPQKALDPFDKTFDWKAVGSSPIIDHPKDMLRESLENDQNRLDNRERTKPPNN